MTYTPPKYPGEIPSAEDLPDRTDDIDWLYAARYNELKKELRAALAELGTNPKGTYDDVKARLVALEEAGLPAGVIVMWSGTLANIPSGWALCDGTGSTPNLLDKFIKGVPDDETDPGSTGGNINHKHEYSDLPVHNHGITDPGHTHSYVSSSSEGAFEYGEYGGSEEPGAKTTGSKVTGITTNNEGDVSPETENEDGRPPYYEVAYIIKE